MTELSLSLDSDLEKFIKDLGGVISEKTEDALDQASASILNSLRTNYLQESDPFGAKWLESQAARDRKLTGRGGGTLFDSGRLFHSIQLFESKLGERVIGTDVPYGVYHQLGLGQERRTFLEFTPDHIDTAVKIFELRLSEAFS